MSFLYSNVDANLQAELNARGKTGIRRGPRDLAFMLEKIANVELIAYNSSASISPNNRIASIGGDQLLSGRYLPTGKDGFLNDSKTYNIDGINFNDISGLYSNVKTSGVDSSRKIGPFITSVDITTVDHTITGQNTATINITIPNPERDLDIMEDIWLKPGRYISVTIKHPDSVIVSYPETLGLLTPNVLPKKERLQKKYPDWKLDDNVMNSLRQMNEYIFEGLITNFELSYQASGQIDVTLSVRGNSNSFVDVALFSAPDVDVKPEPVPTTNSAVIIDQPAVSGGTAVPEPPATTPVVPPFSNFFATLYKLVNDLIKSATGESTPNYIGCIDFNTGKGAPYPNTDHYIVFGEPFPSTIKPKTQKFMGIPTNFCRYITLGALIRFINDYTISTMAPILPAAEIMCDDLQCGSNHYDYLTSCNPKDILFLPSNTDNKGDMNWYGDLAYYQKLSDPANKNPVYGPVSQKLVSWPGIDAQTSPKFLHSSKILINMETIQDIILGHVDAASGNRQYGLVKANKSDFTVKALMATISSKILYASGGSIKMTLLTHPSDSNKLLFADTNYLKTQINENEPIDEIVEGYSIPMFVNHPSGTVVRDFKLQSSVPTSVKALMYVANGSTDISQESIGPYMNYMYNEKNADALNRLMADYSAKHTAAIKNIITTKASFSNAPTLSENISALYQALTQYFKYPTDEIKKSNKLTAPIFPFSAEFTIDGINGFRYGDQIKFVCLPTNYRENTLFSVMGVTQTVGSTGEWTTTVRCVMRPNIL